MSDLTTAQWNVVSVSSTLAMSLSPQSNSAVNNTTGIVRCFSAKWKTERRRNRNKMSPKDEIRGAAVPYHDPDVPDDGEHDDYVFRKDSGNSDGGNETVVDGENNEVSAYSSSDVTDTSSSLSFALSTNSPWTAMEQLSATALLRRARSLGLPPASDVTGSHAVSGDDVVANGSHHVANGVYARSKSLGCGQGFLGEAIVFDVRRELLASLAENGDADRLRAVLKADNEAVNGTDEVIIAICFTRLGLNINTICEVCIFKGSISMSSQASPRQSLQSNRPRPLTKNSHAPSLRGWVEWSRVESSRVESSGVE